MPGWFETVKSERAYDGSFFAVRSDQVAMPDGSTATREIVEHTGAVAVVPLMDDGTVVLLRQYRHALSQYVIEIPAGKLDVPDEDPAEAANRELIEEIGHRAGKLELLASFHNSVGWTDEVTHVYRGTRLEGAERPAGFTASGEEADMEILRWPLEAAVEAARDGTITDAKTIIGLLRAQGR